MKTSLGSYSIYRQPKARPEGLPQFEWKWIVRFFVGTGKPLTRLKHPYRLCDKCLAETGNPVKTRAGCKQCQEPVHKWAKKFLEAHTAMLQRGELDRLQELINPKKWAPVSEVLEVYLERGPKDRRQRVNFLASIYEQTTGKALVVKRVPTPKDGTVKPGRLFSVQTTMVWEDLTRTLIYDWVELRQEAGRRGWLGLAAGKNMPPDGWEKLRELQRARKLRRDTETAAAWNTTILGHVVSAKSIFNGMSRDDTLRGLNIPPLDDFLGVQLTKMLPVPKGHREIDHAVMARIVKELPELKAKNPRVWAFVLLCAWLSGRPGKALELRGDALKVQEDGTGIITQPEAKGGNESFTMVDAECVAAVLAVRTDASLFGVKHATDAKLILVQANEWLTNLGMEGTKKMSMFRHHKLQILRNQYGDEMAAAAAGHTTTAMVRSTYTRNEKVVPLVNPFEQGKAQGKKPKVKDKS
jgi:hypothetical protein